MISATTTSILQAKKVKTSSSEDEEPDQAAKAQLEELVLQTPA
jgi:hypothetical protein